MGPHVVFVLIQGEPRVQEWRQLLPQRRKSRWQRYVPSWQGPVGGPAAAFAETAMAAAPLVPSAVRGHAGRAACKSQGLLVKHTL
jgi:hypothetical protein